MPKLLQRNILRNSYISLISSLIAVVCWSVFMVSGYVYIYTLNLCTYCNEDIKLHSYRKSNGDYGRLFSFVILK